jgi:DNA replication protein DnaC
MGAVGTTPVCRPVRRNDGTTPARSATTATLCWQRSPPPRPRLATGSADGLSHQQFQHRLIAEQADRRHEHSIAHRIRERQPLRAFDWEFNRSAIDRVQIEELATGAFIARQDKLVFVGQSGVGKSFLSQAIAEATCVQGYSVLYTTSAALLMDLIPSLSDQRLPQRVRYYGRFDPLVLDEFGFEKIERSASPQAANLLYRVSDARSRRRSTALVTNINFAAWGGLPGGSADGAGVPGPGGGWGDHREDQRQVLPGPSCQCREASQ